MNGFDYCGVKTGCGRSLVKPQNNGGFESKIRRVLYFADDIGLIEQ